jgi:phytoene dehydrogenase-like protein
MRSPAWPPQSLTDLFGLARTGAGWLAADPAGRSAALLQDALRSVSHRLPADERLRLFVDGQLLIAAQATSERANALYGAAALDLPRRGVVHLEGGIGAIATALADAVRANGGTILYRQEVSQIESRDGRPVGVRTKRGRRFPADLVIANLPPWNIARFYPDDVPRPLRHLPPQPEQGWGAFTVYAGVDASIVNAEMPLHHQLLLREPLGEGNSLFLSFSPAWDEARAPAGYRALTISTHTDFRSWWRLFATDRAAYERRKAAYADTIMRAAELALPGLLDAARLILPGTPVTFQRYTRRQWGWVGGFPQVNLFQAWGPRLAPGLWMVGDSIFPGQSTAAVALGGLRVARQILHEGPEPISRRLERPVGSPGFQAGGSV